MTTGAYISGAAHLALILWALLGGILFQAETEDAPDTTDVRLLSESEFLSLTANRPEPEIVQELETPSAPTTEENQTVASLGDLPSETQDSPEMSDPSETEAIPEAPDLSVPEANVDTATPAAPAPTPPPAATSASPTNSSSPGTTSPPDG